MNDLLYAIWLILPAFAANAVPVLVGGAIPIDFGRTVWGARVLGDGKTWRGFAGGLAAGLLTGVVANVMHSTYGGGYAAARLVLALSLGALLGDLIESFLKRRTGKHRGERWLIADQVDFLIGALLLCFLVDGAWFYANFTPERVVFLLVLTPVLHVVTNICAHAFKLKKVPW
jgi:CDP-2,3-bis-(O-geranylgeranyl)-sn-glycerol synthase